MDGYYTATFLIVWPLLLLAVFIITKAYYGWLNLALDMDLVFTTYCDDYLPIRID